jgi:hypothetical protein
MSSKPTPVEDCPICAGPLFFTTPCCSQNICKKCVLKKWQESELLDSCPYCRADIYFSVKEDRLKSDQDSVKDKEKEIESLRAKFKERERETADFYFQNLPISMENASFLVRRELPFYHRKIAEMYYQFARHLYFRRSENKLDQSVAERLLLTRLLFVEERAIRLKIKVIFYNREQLQDAIKTYQTWMRRKENEKDRLLADDLDEFHNTFGRFNLNFAMGIMYKENLELYNALDEDEMASFFDSERINIVHVIAQVQRDLNDEEFARRILPANGKKDKKCFKKI